MNKKDLVKTGYNRIAKEYLAARTHNPEQIQLLDDLTSRLPENATVLDAGCGAGVPITETLSTRFEATGVDFSETQIELASKNVPNARFLCGDMTQLDFPADTFHAICSFYAIIHVPREEHGPLFINFHRMLKPGGYALLCLGAENLLDDIEEEFFGARMYWSHYDRDTYLNMLQGVGFLVIWSKIIPDSTCEGASHLFVLAQKIEP
jgi:SAM-dependent methyltransferase